MKENNKVKIDIWSDIRCPFCYIGKRKFEAALKQFDHKDDVEVAWRSFQLDPSLTSKIDQDIYDYLAQRKGQTRQWSEKVHHQMTNTAKEAGLDFHFEKVIVAGSYDAQRIVQLAKTQGLDDAMEEALFKAYFTDGRDITDHETLVNLGIAIGLKKDEIQRALGSDAFAEEVHMDGAEAESIGVTGVPFFVFNNRYAVSGAQSPEVFLEALQYTWNETAKENKHSVVNVTDENACSTDDTC